MPSLLLDIESSALRDGFPIEIAWCDCEAGAPEAYLIRPPRRWLSALVWDEVSAAVHGIPLNRLLGEGTPIRQVADRVRIALSGVSVYSDAPHHDQVWLDLLMHCAGHPAPRIEPIETLWATALPAGPATVDLAERAAALVALVTAAEAGAGQPVHRARADVLRLRRIWHALPRGREAISGGT